MTGFRTFGSLPPNEPDAPPRLRANRPAVASFVCGLLVIVPVLPGLAAIALGIIGISRARARRVGGRSLAMMGFTLGITNVALWVLIATTVGPPALRARERASELRCLSNLRALGQGLQAYQTDHRRFPPSLADDAIGRYFAAGRPPACSSGGPLVYVADPKLRPSQVRPAEYVVAYDPPSNHKSGGMGVLYADGHAEWVDATRARRLIEDLRGGRNPPAIDGAK